jgi:hypothetical protein
MTTDDGTFGMTPQELREHSAYTKAIQDTQFPLGLLRAHLLTESYLERIIRVAIPKPDVLLNDGNLSYSRKLDLVEALQGVPEKYIVALRSLNRIRNRYAHDLGYDVSLADAEAVGKPLGQPFVELKNEFHSDHYKLLGLIIGHLCAAMVGHVTGMEDDLKKYRSVGGIANVL